VADKAGRLSEPIVPGGPIHLFDGWALIAVKPAEEFCPAAFRGDSSQTGDSGLLVPHPSLDVERPWICGDDGFDSQSLWLATGDRAVWQPFAQCLANQVEALIQ